MCRRLSSQAAQMPNRLAVLARVLPQLPSGEATSRQGASTAKRRKVTLSTISSMQLIVAQDLI
jgi:hypothetical protein